MDWYEHAGSTTFLAPMSGLLGELRGAIEGGGFVFLEGPALSGKSVLLDQLEGALRFQDRFEVVRRSCRDGSFGSTVAEAGRLLLSSWSVHDGDADGAFDDVPARELAAAWISKRARQAARPMVLLLDDVVSLPPKAHGALLGQLSQGLKQASRPFPFAVVLAGRWHPGRVLGGGPAYEGRSFRMPRLTREQVEEICDRLAGPGPAFRDETVDHLFHLTRGHPWVVSLLAGRT